MLLIVRLTPSLPASPFEHRHALLTASLQHSAEEGKVDENNETLNVYVIIIHEICILQHMF